jgi:ribosomal protein S20
VFYYLDQVLRFFQRFLKAEYAVDVVELLRLYVKEEHLVTLGLVRRDDEVAPLDKLFELSPEAAVLQAYSLVERKLYRNLPPESDRPGRIGPAGRPSFPQILSRLAGAGFLSVEDLDGFRNLRDMRNRAAHAAHFPDAVPREDWRAALETSKSIIAAVDKAARAGLFDQAAAERQSAETADNGEEHV